MPQGVLFFRVLCIVFSSYFFFSAKTGKKKKNNKTVVSNVKRELVIRDNNQEQYGQITKNLGDGRMMVWCFPHTKKKVTEEDNESGEETEKTEKTEKIEKIEKIEKTEKKGSERLGVIRGKLRKRVWMVVGDIVLVSLRDFQDQKCDIIHKYDNAEVRKLLTSGEIPDGGIVFFFFSVGFPFF
jgi:translation initiation factor 1A